MIFLSRFLVLNILLLVQQSHVIVESSSTKETIRLQHVNAYFFPNKDKTVPLELNEKREMKEMKRHRGESSHKRTHYKRGVWDRSPAFFKSKNNMAFESTTKDTSIPENPVGLTDPSLLIGLYEEYPDLRETEAQFIGTNGSVVTAQIGTTANISCTVINKRDHETVSWIRIRDHHIITIGRQTYSNDDRFTVTYNRHSHEWILHLRYVQSRDEGRYVCQISTHPPMVFMKTLTITEAISEISGGPHRIVEEGSAVKLNCTLINHSQPPDFVFWYHNRSMINFDINRKVNVSTHKDGSVLTLLSVSRTDSGNYTCVPPKAQPTSIMLHVILDDAPAAMQISQANPIIFLHCIDLCIVLLFLLL